MTQWGGGVDCGEGPERRVKDGSEISPELEDAIAMGRTEDALALKPESDVGCKYGHPSTPDYKVAKCG